MPGRVVSNPVDSAYLLAMDADETASPVPAAGSDEPFWRRLSLPELNEAQWECLCDGCGRCCLVKLEDEDSGDIAYTDVGCTLLDPVGCRCRDYPGRQARVPDCLRLTPTVVAELSWLPPTCAYRLIDEGRDLYWWHPLVSGDPDSVHAAGVSIRGRVSSSEDDVSVYELLDRLVTWPEEEPPRLPPLGTAKRR